MLLLCVSDIHGNLDALRAVLATAEKRAFHKLLVAGDIVATGTPTGAGARFDPPRWLKPGDAVEVEVSGIGALRNPIVEEPR